jgi:hypothetical protein
MAGCDGTGDFAAAEQAIAPETKPSSKDARTRDFVMTNTKVRYTL